MHSIKIILEMFLTINYINFFLIILFILPSLFFIYFLFNQNLKLFLQKYFIEKKNTCKSTFKNSLMIFPLMIVQPPVEGAMSPIKAFW